jgi:hypothetical protein
MPIRGEEIGRIWPILTVNSRGIRARATRVPDCGSSAAKYRFIGRNRLI